MIILICNWKKLIFRNVVQPCAVPIVVLGTKYDLFRDLEPELKKVVSKFLRFICHYNGATLLFVSQQEESTLNKVIITFRNLYRKFKQVMNALAFKTTQPKFAFIDHSKPIAVTAGNDDQFTML